jgi:hypothetical protein
MKDSKEQVFFCKCGCHNGICFKFDYDEEYTPTLNISLVNDLFYINQLGFFKRFIEKLKKIYCIIFNKEYYYFDIVIEDEEINRLKEVIKSIGE